MKSFHSSVIQNLFFHLVFYVCAMWMWFWLNRMFMFHKIESLLLHYSFLKPIIIFFSSTRSPLCHWLLIKSTSINLFVMCQGNTDVFQTDLTNFVWNSQQKRKEVKKRTTGFLACYDFMFAKSQVIVNYLENSIPQNYKY